MKPELRFDHLSQPNETLRQLTPADIDIPVMRQQLTEAGYKLDIGEVERKSLAEKTFKRRSTGRGPGMVAVLREEKTVELFAWCKTRSEGGPHLGHRDKVTGEFIPTEGSEGRGLRQLAADIIQLVTDPAPSNETVAKFCERTNQRVMKGMIEEHPKKNDRQIIRTAFIGVPEPESTFSSVPSGSVADLWEFLTSNKETIKQPDQFAESLKLGMTNDEFIALIGEYLTPEDVEVLGGQEMASSKLADSWAYLGVFSSDPSATFDKFAFMMTAGSGLPENEAEKSLEVALRLGVAKDASNISVGRYSMGTGMVEKLHQFLT